MRLKKRSVKMLFLLLIALFFFFFPRSSTQESQTSPTPIPSPYVATGSAKVIRAIDGDTIELENKQRVRYIGIDTPELHHPTKPVGCFARETYEENKRLVEGKIVILEKDITDKDKYGRLLRYVYLPPDQRETTSSGFFVNDYLVRRGFAVVSTFPPDVKYTDQFLRAQKFARENNYGLWRACR